MVLKIRLARFGKKHAPFYNIVVAHARTARNSKPLEVLGTYDPIPKEASAAADSPRKYKDIKLDISRAKYWVGVGAQPSDTAWRLLSMAGILEPKYNVQRAMQLAAEKDEKLRASGKGGKKVEGVKVKEEVLEEAAAS